MNLSSCSMISIAMLAFVKQGELYEANENEKCSANAEHFLLKTFLAALSSFKAKVTRALEGQISFITLYEHAVCISVHHQLQAIAAFKLEGGEICGGGGVEIGAAAAMAGNVGALGHYRCGNGQSGGMVVFVPLLNASDKGENEHTHNQRKHHKP